MEDQEIKEALAALTRHCNLTLQAHLSLAGLVAKKLPNLSEDERSQLENAVAQDETRLKQLQGVIQNLEK